MADIIIDYDPLKGRFLLQSPVWLIGRMRAIPNRTWNSSRKVWTAPGIRINVEYIKSEFKDATLTPAASKYLMEYVPKRPVTSSFPIWYKFKRDPNPHQLDALNKTYGLKASGLFMDMRTRKTKVIIDKYCAMRMEDKVNRLLLICPLSLRKNWLREITKDAPFELDVHLLNTDKPKLFDQWNTAPGDFKWLMVGVESLAAGGAINYAKRFLNTSLKSACVVDESSKIKNPAATRTKNAISLARMAEYREILTGTPIAKGPLDLYAQFEFLDPDIIGVGDYYSFRNRYAVMGGYEDKEVIGYQNMDELIEVISPFIFQVRQSEVLDIPEKIRVLRTVQLSPEQTRLYRSMKKNKSVVTGDLKLVAANVLGHMLRMQEITSGIVTYDNPNRTTDRDPKFISKMIEGENPKIRELIEVTREYEGPTIVWCVYKKEIEMVAAALRLEYGDDQVVEIHGGVSEADRDLNVNVKFQGLQSRFIVGNAATGGMGLTMDKALVEVYMSNSYNYVDREQSLERATGLGKVAVIVVDIMVENTVDEIILEALEEKKDVSEYVRGSIDKINKRLFD